MKRRVVITGAGMVTPFGIGVEKNWYALCQGQSGIGPITRFDASSLKCQVAGEVKDFHPEDYMDQKFIRRFDPFIKYAMAASVMAVDNSGLKTGEYDQYRIGVVIGTTYGTTALFEEAHTVVMRGDLRKVLPNISVNHTGNIVAGTIAIRFGAKGPHHCFMEACASGTNTIGMGSRLIQYGEADIIIAGGSDACITPTLIASLDNLGVLSSKRNGQPEKASRPFDSYRDGMVISEGSGIVILESLDNALKRGARIYGEVAGWGNNCDAYHPTSPEPNGDVQARCMQLAIHDAGISPEDVDYINAHGTSTLLADASETKAIKKAFGDHAKKLAISSNKSMIGHMCGASGTVEAIFTLLTMRDDLMPPTINQDVVDPECDLDYVPNHARKAEVNIALSNSFGFGGINGSVVLKKYSE